jgi:predicted dehydrogenase
MAKRKVTVVRAGIIGAGFIGGVHARAVRAAGGVVACVAEVDRDRATDAQRRLGAVRSTASVADLVEGDDVEVVHVCTPNALHAGAVEMALRAGKHVICEKPLATNVDDARRLEAMADGGGVVATIPFVYRYYPAVREVRDRIARGDSGDLQLLHGRYLQDWLSAEEDTNWRVTSSLGGASRAFADIGVHWCDLLEFTTGHRIARVSATLLRAMGDRGRAAERTVVDTEDAALVLFETGAGAVGSVVLSQVSLGRKNQLWFSWDGTSASYVFDQEQPESLWIGGRHENKVLMRGSSLMSEAASRYVTVPAGHPQGFQDCFNAFVADAYAATGGQRPEGLPDFADGARAAEITAAVVESATHRTWIEVKP